ncbi:MAG: hypothetical protein Q4C42_11025 [Clostridia bacterium]|nr:hypothetical protein [Clostridia bacterium]
MVKAMTIYTTKLANNKKMAKRTARFDVRDNEAVRAEVRNNNTAYANIGGVMIAIG